MKIEKESVIIVSVGDAGDDDTTTLTKGAVAL